ncbi:DEKNAAC100356 [Brettanomyces naardenensis]|uniref:DEKNAAC100356 n=1 Tax=Brettanomyces naardenensis TaxID=13370 RepID=A0A448YGM0_BRENA|nr:DEKNAAC100356 [Brettanomyces naardenensis]
MAGKKTKSKNTVNDSVYTEDVDIPEATEEERYLEKLVFGDQKGFESNLRQVDRLYDEEEEKQEEGEKLLTYDSDSDDEYLSKLHNQEECADSVGGSESEGEDELAKLNDDELFIVDESDDEEKMDVDSESESRENAETLESGSGSDSTSTDVDAWEDSEDEQIEVHIMSSDKLRKLRRTEEEDHLTGKRYIARLRAQFERIYPRPAWADEYETKTQEIEDGVEKETEAQTFDSVGTKSRSTVVSASSNPLIDFLRTNQTYKFEDKNLNLLPPERIDIVRLTDGNAKKPSKSAVQSISFHQSHPLLLTGGYDRTLRVFHIDGKNNNLVTSLHLRNSPIQNACFNVSANDSTEIFAGGRRRYMYKWNVTSGTVEKINRLYGHESTQKSFENFKLSPDGKYIGLMGNSGWINLLLAKTGQWVRGFKIEGTLVDFDFSHTTKPDSGSGSSSSAFLVVINSGGEIWEFDVATGDILSRWTDNSGVGVTKIRIGGYNDNNRWLAVGSNTGIVNIYDRMKENKLIGTVENLITTISSLEFNKDGQLLCIASRDKRDALRLVHIPSCRVYKNWPTSGTPLGKVTSVSFSPDSGILATGNEAGKVRLWKLNHY